MVSPKPTGSAHPHGPGAFAAAQEFSHPPLGPTLAQRWGTSGGGQHQHGRAAIHVAHELKDDPSKLGLLQYYDPLDEEDAAFLAPEDEKWQPPAWVAQSASARLTKRAKRLLLIFALLLLPLSIAWRFYILPQRCLVSNIALAFQRQAARELAGTGKMSAHAEAAFKGVTLLASLDPSHLPAAAPWPGAREKRLIFIGDVHGCKDELVELLDTLGFSSEHDHLIFTGDLIAKGPDSAGAIDLAMEVGASCVRGNWDDRVLLAWEALHRGWSYDEADDSNSTLLEKASEEEIQRSIKDRAYMTALGLKRKHIKWLQACPCILDVGVVDGVGRMAVAHAGLAPGVPLPKQDPYSVMNMRSIDLRTLTPLEGRKGVEWEKVWGAFQDTTPEQERVTVVYGHDSKRGLNLQRWSKGLDSGCANGSRLTALIVDNKGTMTLESIPCRNNYRKWSKEQPLSTDGQH